ncbi:MAG: SIS domain-containing protein [Candidatus Asgardarchaeia archaeon]
MIRIEVPIREDDLEISAEVARNTSFYILEQTLRNVDVIFESEGDNLIDFLGFLGNSSDKRVHFAARGRTLLMGARTLADRLIQLGYRVAYPTLEQYIVYDPNARISKEDLLLAMSTSGYTSKVIKKSRFARKKGCEIITFTTNQTSPLAMLTTKLLVIIKDKYERENIIKKYDPKPFTPLGTLSEFTQLVLMESLSSGLREYIVNNKGEEECFKYSKEVARRLIEIAKKSLEETYSKYEYEINTLLANLLLKYYSQQTVHLCGRGKTFNIAVGPFKMRLDQIPNAFVTSILDFELLNRPVRKGQITIVVSGSGLTYPIAKRAKENNSLIIGITSYENKLWELSDVKIMIPGRPLAEKGGDWDIRQWTGWKAEFAPKGTNFEISACSFLDGIFAGISNYIGISEESMKTAHANIE